MCKYERVVMPKKILKASCNREDYKSIILTEEQLCSFVFFLPLKLLPLIHFCVEKTKILECYIVCR